MSETQLRACGRSDGNAPDIIGGDWLRVREPAETPAGSLAAA